jgi:glycosyltransferase involved in cell wall biosynthesis
MTSSAPLRIGYVNQDFPPEVGAGPARILEMSQFWQSAGAEVTVITGLPNRRMAGLEDGAIHPDYRRRLFMEEDWQGIRVLRSWLYSSPRRGFAHVLANNASFMVTSMMHALRRAPAFDIVIASSPPFLAHVTGAAIRRIQRIPLILEIRDLWPDYMVEMGVLRNPAGRSALFSLERFLLRRAARAVVVTESFRARLRQKGVPYDRIDVIPNGVDLDRYYRDPNEEPPFAELVRRDGEFLVGYLGNFGAGQDLRTLVDAARQLQDSAPGVRFILAGDGKEKPKVLEHARAAGVRNIAFHAPIEKEQTRAFYNACDVCLVPLAPIPIFQETVPSKLFEIMACQRPLIAGVAGEAARIVENSGCGIVTDPGSAAALARAVLEISGADDASRAVMGKRGRGWVAEHYNRRTLAARYLEILRHTAGRLPIATPRAAGLH